MTQAPELHVVEDLEREWPRLQPLLAALDEHHARLLGKPISPKHQEMLRRRLSKASERGLARVLLVEADGEPAGLGHAVIFESSHLFRERIGLLNNFYLRDGLRGSWLVRRLHEDLEGWLRGNGVREAQRSTFVANERALRLWQLMGYHPYMITVRKGPEAATRAPSRGPEVRQVADLNARWPELRGLISGLQRHHVEIEGREAEPRHEESVKKRLAKPLAKGKATLLVAQVGGSAAGMVSGTIVKSPSVFQEQVGVINDLFVLPELRGSAVMRSLLSAAERWLLERGAEELEATIVGSNRRTLKLSEHHGYRPFALTLRKRLLPPSVRLRMPSIQ